MASEISGNRKLDMENLKARWSFATTQRERAVLERKMWDLGIRDAKTSAGGCSRWIHETLNTPLRGCEGRTSLLIALPHSEALWKRVDGPEHLLLESADKILSRSRLRMVAESVTLVEAIDRELAEYDTYPTLVKTPEGNYRKRPGVRRGLGGSARSTKIGSRERWNTVRAALWQVLDSELLCVTNAHTRGKLRSQAEAEIDGVLRVLQTRIQAAKRSPDTNDDPLVRVETSRKELARACRVLSVDPPTRNKRVDHKIYMVAKKNFRKLVKQYHPDVSGSDSAEQYDEIVKALRLVEQDYQDDGSATDATETTTTGDDDHGDK
jgi:hypothetical protein